MLEKVLFVREKHMLDQTARDRQVAAAPCYQVQPVVRWKMYSQEAHVHRAHVYTMYIYIDRSC